MNNYPVPAGVSISTISKKESFMVPEYGTYRHTTVTATEIKTHPIVAMAVVIGAVCIAMAFASRNRGFTQTIQRS